MDDYFLKDEKTAPQRLNADLDDYWKAKDAAAPAPAQDAAPEGGAEEEAAAE